MESRVFVRVATNLIADIAAFRAADQNQDMVQTHGMALQKDINAAFSGLQNPTLPTAEKLMESALEAGFTVHPQVQHRIRSSVAAWMQG